MVLRHTAAAVSEETLRKKCMARLPLLSPEITSLMTRPDASMLETWSGSTWVKLTREAVGGSDPTGGGSDPTDAWCVQCTACGMLMGKWKWGNLLRHHKSRKHQFAVLNAIGVNVEGLTAVPGAPTASAFAQVWKELRAGAARIGTESLGCDRGKIWRMMCCLGEAAFMMDRRFLKDKGTIAAIHRDEKNGRLQLDYTACNTKLETRAGTMGIMDNQGGTFGIVATTKEVFERFWTDIHGVFDIEGYNSFRNAVELINTDAAPDEIAAAREQSMPSAPQLRTALTPNVRVIARDRAHGSQRQAARAAETRMPMQHLGMHSCVTLACTQAMHSERMGITAVHAHAPTHIRTCMHMYARRTCSMPTLLACAGCCRRRGTATRC